jgi:hypothetical protein
LDWWTNGENYHLYRGGTDCDGITSSRGKKREGRKKGVLEAERDGREQKDERGRDAGNQKVQRG